MFNSRFWRFVQKIKMMLGITFVSDNFWKRKIKNGY